VDRGDPGSGDCPPGSGDRGIGGGGLDHAGRRRRAAGSAVSGGYSPGFCMLRLRPSSL
jgi:hypothetical protein